MISNPEICKKSGILDVKWGFASENQKIEDLKKNEVERLFLKISYLNTGILNRNGFFDMKWRCYQNSKKQLKFANWPGC